MFRIIKNRNAKRKKVDRSRPAIPIFRGEKERHEKYDISKSSPESDFGRAYYWGLRFIPARNWSLSSSDEGYVSWYIFDIQSALSDMEVQPECPNDPINWLDIIIKFKEKRYDGKAQIIMGDMIDGAKGAVLDEYRAKAKMMGITSMLDFPDSIKQEMIDKLHPDRFDQQVAFRNEKALSYLEHIGTAKVKDMSEWKYSDPSAIAANVIIMLISQDKIDEYTATKAFLSSNTFRRVIAEPKVAQLPPTTILNMYRQEVRNNA